jgi:hypothetical protein
MDERAIGERNFINGVNQMIANSSERFTEAEAKALLTGKSGATEDFTRQVTNEIFQLLRQEHALPNKSIEDQRTARLLAKSLPGDIRFGTYENHPDAGQPLNDLDRAAINCIDDYAQGNFDAAIQDAATAAWYHQYYRVEPGTQPTHNQLESCITTLFARV